jgi:hypothetical protein
VSLDIEIEISQERERWGLQRKVKMDCKRGRLMFEVLMRFIIVEGVAYGEYAYEVPSNAECMLAVAKII